MLPQMQGIWYQFEPWKKKIIVFSRMILGFIVSKERKLPDFKKI
jgi:hypothetical protein